MNSDFTEMITFQVKPDKVSTFETLISSLKSQLTARPGCIGLRIFKRFYTFDGVEFGQPPRELTKIVVSIRKRCFFVYLYSSPCCSRYIFTMIGQSVWMKSKPRRASQPQPFSISSLSAVSSL